MKFIVMTGDPDGFTFFGPFDNEELAYEFGATCIHAAWFVCELHDPKEEV